MNSAFRKIDIVLCFFCALGFGSVSAQTVWIDGVGDWNTAANWSAGVPNSATDANINNGGEAQLNGASGTSRDLVLGLNANDSGTMTVDGSSGAASLTTRDIIVGNAGTGLLKIIGGATVTTGPEAFLGDVSTGKGTVVIDGVGSTWTVTSLYVGGDSGGPEGTGILRITNGGTVTGSTNVLATGTLEIGANPNVNGTLTFYGGELRALTNTTLSSNAVLSGAGVTLDSNGFDSTLSGHWSGTGDVQKVGKGSFTFSNTNSYTGGTFVNAGTLFVDGSISSDTYVYPGGTLGGGGNISGLVNNDGVVSPGHNSVGLLEVISGPYTQQPGGTLRMEIGGPLFATDSDALAVVGGGKAFLNGTLRLIRVNNYNPTPGDQVLIVDTNTGVIGEFDRVLSTFRTLVQPRVVYDPDDVRVVFYQASFNQGGLTPNERVIAHQLNRNVNDPALVDLIDALNLVPINNLASIYDEIAPEELASIYEIGFSQAVVQNDNLMRRMDDIRAGSNGFSSTGFAPNEVSQSGLTKGGDGKTILDKNPSVFVPCPENRWGVFVTGSGDFVRVSDDDFNAAGYDINTGDVTLGVDYRLGDHFAIGLDGAYSGSTANLVNAGRVEVDGEKIGGYLTAFWKGFFGGKVYVDLAGSAGWNDYDTRRTGLLGADVNGNTDGAEWNGLLAYGSDWTFGGFTIGTWSTLQYTKIDIDGFSESGSLVPLQFPDQDQDSFRATSGIRANYEARFGKCGIVRPELRAAWQHEYQERSYPIDASFGSGFDTFTVRGPKVGRDAALLGAGVDVQWCSRFATYLYYDGVIGRSNYDSNAVSGGVRVSF